MLLLFTQFITSARYVSYYIKMTKRKNVPDCAFSVMMQQRQTLKNWITILYAVQERTLDADSLMAATAEMAESHIPIAVNLLLCSARVQESFRCGDVDLFTEVLVQTRSGTADRLSNFWLWEHLLSPLFL